MGRHRSSASTLWASIPSARAQPLRPYIGHALEALKAGTIKRAMIIGKGSLFLGRLTNLADGASFIMEGPGAGTEPAQGVSQSDVTEMLLAALSDVAANLQKG